MKKLITTIIAIFLFSGIILLYLIQEQHNFHDDSPYHYTTQNQDKKKILIFSCKGGGGHISMMQALTEYLEQDFCIGHAYIFSDVLRPIDPLGNINNTISTTNMYNSLLKKKWHAIINFMEPIGSYYFKLQKNQITNLLQSYLAKYKPDLIISVIPLVNAEILEAAQKENIPFILIPSDLDACHITTNTIKKPLLGKFHLALSYVDQEIFERFKDLKNLKEHISVTGFPVKKAFFSPISNKKSIRKYFSIPEDKPVILLMMGSQGSKEISEFSWQLSKLKIPAHLIIVLGKSEHLRRSLKSIFFPKNITVSILGFTNRIPDLMNISNLIISKSGSITVNEAIYAQVPILLDATSTILRWEAFNHRFIEKNGFGTIVKTYKNIPKIVTQMLIPAEQERMKKNLATFDKKNPEQEIKLLVRNILQY